MSEQERFYEKLNFASSAFVGYKLQQIILGVGMFVAMLMFKLDIPFVSYLTAFAIMWVFSYFYTRGLILFIIFLIAIGDILFIKSEAKADNIVGKLDDSTGFISFVFTIIFCIILSNMNDPEPFYWHAIFAPFVPFYYMLK